MAHQLANELVRMQELLDKLERLICNKQHIPNQASRISYRQRRLNFPKRRIRLEMLAERRETHFKRDKLHGQLCTSFGQNSTRPKGTMMVTLRSKLHAKGSTRPTRTQSKKSVVPSKSSKWSTLPEPLVLAVGRKRTPAKQLAKLKKAKTPLINKIIKLKRPLSDKLPKIKKPKCWDLREED